jgi:hypothetical protein
MIIYFGLDAVLNLTVNTGKSLMFWKRSLSDEREAKTRKTHKSEKTEQNIIKV